MKNLQNLKGAKLLSKKEQKAINGGKALCRTDADCDPEWTCLSSGICVLM